MLFTTSIFWIFFIIVFCMIFVNSKFIGSTAFQNLILLISSYIFYGAWDWRFVSLLLLVSTISFISGRQIGLSVDPKIQRFWLIVSIVTSLSILGVFKYFNFFVGEFTLLLNTFNIPVSWTTLHIILPVGISFFTFQTLTYTIDIYLGRMEREKDPIKYFTYVAFFPQLVAGPIERASNLLPQLQKTTSITWPKIYQGISLIIFGLFLKVVVADSLAPIVDKIFSDVESQNGGELLLGAVYFACQIYGDFCGYSTIAIGVSYIMGFRLMTNFNTPYFSKSIQEFWRNWHISLSSFFRDYIYIPLGGSRNSQLSTIRNILVTFMLSGLWHGANWTFLAWGSLHGFAIIAALYLRQTTKWMNHRIKSILGWIATMVVVLVGWVIFRSPDLNFALGYLYQMVTDFEMSDYSSRAIHFVLFVVLIDCLWVKNVRLRNGIKLPFPESIFKSIVESMLLSIMLLMIVYYLVINGGNNEFIYFQF